MPILYVIIFIPQKSVKNQYFTIFLVIWGHVVQQSLNPGVYPEQVDGIYRLIYTFHMPLFMGISGYFFGKSVCKVGGVYSYLKKKLKKRILGLIIPMLSFGVIAYFVQVFMEKKVESPLTILQQAHNIWFLGDLVIYTFVVLVVSFLCNQKFSHDWKYLLAGAVLTCIPQVGYGFRGPFFYLYYIAGYCIAMYLTNSKIVSLSKYGKEGVIVFLLTYALYSNLPWPFEHFQANWHSFSFIRIFTVISLKIILGFIGSYIALYLIYQMCMKLQSTWLFRKASRMGAYTLDIYLIQMILVERILGPVYRQWMDISGIDYLHMYGLLVEFIVTFSFAVVLIEIICWISRLVNKSPALSYFLFYRKIS